jgi:general secretion pathway protein G
MLKKTLEKGFTIVELLIVIVVIAILAALVLNTFAGVQQRARDTERTTDIKAIASQLEVYYADNGNYPSFAQLDDSAWRGEPNNNMPGIDDNAFIAPQDGSGLQATVSTDKDQYGYVVTTDDATPASCEAAAGTCQVYTLSWTPEQEGEGLQEIKSLN